MEQILNITQKELDYLKAKDKRMSDLIGKIGKIKRICIPEPFTALCRNIVYQQLSSQAADSIWDKFNEILSDLSPAAIIAAKRDKLRAAGLSEGKVDYLKNLAEAVNNNQLNLSKLDQMTDQEIIEQLVKIKGIGQWTAEMFLIFSLAKKNVISFNDLGIRKGLQWFYGLKNEPTEKDFQKFRKMFSPYNTAASLYIWEVTSQNLDQIFKSAEELSTTNNVGYYKSPIGLIEIQAEQEKLISLDFQEVKRYQEDNTSVISAAKEQLNEYFLGIRKKFKLPLKLEGTDFQETVWQQLTEISYGDTFSYKEVAEAIENDKAYRAVGNANNKNKIPIIIPCHRVTASNGKIGGYGLGIWRKKWLLKHEKENL